MKTVRLGGLCEPVAKWNPKQSDEEDFTYVDLAAVDNESKRITATVEILCSEAPSRARQLIRASDVLVSTVRPNLNAVAHVPTELDGATASTGFSVLRPKSGLDARYLFHWVRTPQFVGDMIKKATGASYPAVSDRIVKASMIPLPPLGEQRRIAAILDEAAAVIELRQSVLDEMQDLKLALFEAMFGSANTPTVKLAEIAAVSSGITKGRKAAGELRDVPYLAVANVQAGHLLLDAVKEIAVTEAEFERYRLEYGDVVLTEGGDPDKLGRGTIWRNEIAGCIHQNHIFKVRFNEDAPVTPEFFSSYLQSNSAKSYFLRSAKQTTGIASINMTQLRRLPVPTPDAHLQQVFAQNLLKIAKNEARVESALSLDRELFASLQYRAFRGEL